MLVLRLRVCPASRSSGARIPGEAASEQLANRLSIVEQVHRPPITIGHRCGWIDPKQPIKRGEHILWPVGSGDRLLTAAVGLADHLSHLQPASSKQDGA